MNPFVGAISNHFEVEDMSRNCVYDSPIFDNPTILDINDGHYAYINKVVNNVRNANFKSRYLVGSCLLLEKSSVNIFGVCQLKSHPLQLKYSNDDNHMFLHAEIDSLRKLIHHHDYEPSVMYVVRFLKSGEFRPSKPCDICAKALTDFKVPMVIYFDETWQSVRL